MVLFSLGLIIFFGSHLFTSFARAQRAALVGRLGNMGYKGLYALFSLAGFVLIIAGWRAAPTAAIYTPIPALLPVAYGLVVAGFVALTAAYLPSGKIKGWTGHPMITGTGLFAAGHLAANGEARSVLLFGGFLAYALLDRLSYRLRGDRGARPGSAIWDVAAIGGALASAAAVVHFLHPYLAGVALDPGQVFGG